MEVFFNFFNQNSSTLSVIFTVIVALCIFIYAFLTIIFVIETRKMRNAQTEELCVDVTYKPRNEWFKPIDITILHMILVLISCH